METQIKVILEKHPDGYVAYPLGVKGVVVGQGDSYQEALDDVRSAIAFHVETFGPEALVDSESPATEYGPIRCRPAAGPRCGLRST